MIRKVKKTKSKENYGDMKKLQEAALRFMDSDVIRKLTQELTNQETLGQREHWS